MGNLYKDLAYAWRVSVRAPSFSLALILVLGIGIASTITIFTVVDGVLFRPLPFRNASRLVEIHGAGTPVGGDRLAWWSQAKTLAALGTYSLGGANLTSQSRVERIRVAVTSASFFPVLGVEPVVGRAFIPDEESLGRNHVALLSHSLAVQNFGGERAALGQKIILNKLTYSTIGVMSPNFGFPGHTDVWVPRLLRGASLDLGSDGQASFPLREAMIGLLRPAVSFAQSRAEFNLLQRRLEDVDRRKGLVPGIGVTLNPLRDRLVKNVRPALLTLFAAVLLVLLIACVDASNLLLSRALVRRKEVAIRISLGASRTRVIRQLLTESIFLALTACALGVLLANWGLSLIRVIAPASILMLADLAIDLRVLAFCLGLSLLTGALIGLVPALQTFTPDINKALKEEWGTWSGAVRQRIRQGFVVAEVALALILISAAGLMVESLRRLTVVAPGFDPQNVVTMELALPNTKFRSRVEAFTPSSTLSKLLPTTSRIGQVTTLEPERIKSYPSGPPKNLPNARVHKFQQDLLERITSLPGVQAAGFVNELPLRGAGGSLAFDVGGVPQKEAFAFDVGGEYFRAIGIPILKGRTFNERDTETGPAVIIINQTIAHWCWGSKNPVGDQLFIEGETAPREIVGVVGDVKRGDLGESPEQQFYFPWFKPYLLGVAAPVKLDMNLVVRSSSDPKTIVPLLQREILALDSDLPVFRVKPMEEVISESLTPPRFRALLLGGFAVVSLLLAMLGVYGLIAYSAASRSHEIGIRMSLGARPRDILLLIGGEGARLSFYGACVGSLAAFGLNKLISSLLFGITATDPTILVTSALLLITAALAASAIPARRASKIEPMTAIRHE